MLNSKVNNWAMELEAFNIEFDYIKGSNNVLADTMSRLVDINPDTQQHPDYLIPSLLHKEAKDILPGEFRVFRVK